MFIIFIDVNIPRYYYIHMSGEATDTNCIVFGLTRSGLEHTIYHIRGEHAIHYTIDACECNRNEEYKSN
jgi:hypothetical protein